MKRKFGAKLLFLLTLTLCGLDYAQTMSAQQGQGGSRGGAAGAGSFTSGARQGRASGPLPNRSMRHSKVPRHQLGVLPGSFIGDGDVSVSIEQTQPSPALLPEKPSQKKYYVPPRWVTQNGVDVLMPSFWTDDPQLAGVKDAGKAQPVLNEY